MSSCFTNKNNFLEKFEYTIEELYVYIHRRDLNSKSDDELQQNKILLVIISILLLFLLAKLILIFFFFILKWVICDIPKITLKLCKYKCFNICKECWNTLQYLKKVIKKIYTYNFYSYDTDTYGKIRAFIIPFSYIIFIISNFIYLNGKNNTDINKNSYFHSVMHLVVFYLHLFIEIYCASFYIIKDLLKHFKFTIISFFAFNFHLLCLYLILDNFGNANFQCSFFVRIARLFLLIFFMSLYSLSLRNVYSYNMNSKYNIII
jgi:hypothetical protein